MKLPRIDFTSYRDPKGYKIVGDTPLPQQEQPLEEISGKARPSGWLQRYIDQSSPAGRLEKGGPWISGHIVGNGGKTEMKQVHLSQWPRAYEEFAKVKTPDGLLEFVTRYGQLYLTATAARPAVYQRQDVLPLLKEARQMRECMRGGTTEAYIRHLSAVLYKDRETGKFKISINTSCLLDALWLQFQHSQASGAEFLTCLACNNPFAVGGDSGRRPFAKFCSDEERMHFNSLARSNPKMRERRIKGRHK